MRWILCHSMGKSQSWIPQTCNLLGIRSLVTKRFTITIHLFEQKLQVIPPKKIKHFERSHLFKKYSETSSDPTFSRNTSDPTFSRNAAKLRVIPHFQETQWNFEWSHIFKKCSETSSDPTYVRNGGSEAENEHEQGESEQDTEDRKKHFYTQTS